MTASELANAVQMIPIITNEDVYFLCNLYGIDKSMIADIKSLPSYSDRVFHISTHPSSPKKSLVLKCSIITTLDRIDMQIQLMHKLIKNNVPSPHPIPLLIKEQQQQTNSHPYIYITSDNPSFPSSTNTKTRKVIIHCMSFVEGILAGDCPFINRLLHEHIGQQIGNLSKALEKWKHKASHFKFDWDLQCVINAVQPNMKYIVDNNNSKLIEYYLDLYKTHLYPNMDGLRHSIIHGDLNDYNMIVSEEYPHELKAFLDFGDCVHSCTIFDIAIACSYFMINECRTCTASGESKSFIYDKCMECMLCMLNAYHAIFPMTLLEMNVVFVAICSRILVSVCISAGCVNDNPDNEEYLLIHAKPGWIFLDVLRDCKPADMAVIIRQRLLNNYGNETTLLRNKL